MTQRRNKEEKKKDFRMSLLVSLPNHHDETDEEQGVKRFIANKINTWEKTKNMENKKDVMQTKSTPETGKEQWEQKNLMQARSTPETDEEQWGKKRFYANQINTWDRQRTRGKKI